MEGNSLVGHSGCDIRLLSKGNTLVLRKTSSSIEYNRRFELQIEKQSTFSDEVLRAPRILDKGYVHGLLYCDMEYINGVKFSDLIVNGRMEQVVRYFRVLLNFISKSFSGDSYSAENEILVKLGEISSKVHVDSDISSFIISNAHREIPSGYCHGDYTFENIVVLNDQIYLIDFLDSYINSPVIDLSKLYQDVLLNWSNRHFIEQNFHVYIRNLYINDLLDEFVQANNIVDVNAIAVQKVMTMLRILPYVKSEPQFKMIMNKLKTLI